MRQPLERPDPAVMAAQVEQLRRYRESRDAAAVTRALDGLARAAASERENVYAALVEAALAGATHGEMVRRLRDAYGFGQPLVVA